MSCVGDDLNIGFSYKTLQAAMAQPRPARVVCFIQSKLFGMSRSRVAVIYIVLPVLGMTRI